MFLVTTADQRFWKTDEKVLFLGGWCKIYNQRHIWSNLDHEVLPYHWDDRERLYRDYLHLDSVYERYLKLLSDRLNELYNVDRSTRYWRIIIGPWLFYFIEILYDRYLSIRIVIDSGLVTGTYIIPKTEEKWTPRDHVVFQKWFIEDLYNQYLYSRLIETLGGMSYDLVNVEISSPLDISSRSQVSLFGARKLLDIYTRNISPRWNSVIFVASYLSKSDLIKLELSMGQFPYIGPSVVPEDIPVKSSIRKKLLLKQGRDEFESILDWFIADQIPTAYVEGYLDMLDRSIDAFPKKPKVILTGNAYYNDEGFKFWAANQIECGAKLVGAQYGGHYGSGRWTAFEAHEINITDRLYTWGWKIEGEPKTIPLSAGKLAKVQRTVKPHLEGSILWVATSSPRYSYWMYSAPVGPQVLDYLHEQYRFAKSVSPEVHELLLLRLYPHDYGWNEAERWTDIDAKLKTYKGTKSIYQQLNESRLFIGTYNATTFLETFSANFPTIIFWNPKHWELRSSAEPYFDELRRVGILHDTPESAAVKVNEIYNDPYVWWRKEEIQKAKDEFCQQFACTSKDWLIEWKRKLLNLTKKEYEKNDIK